MVKNKLIIKGFTLIELLIVMSIIAVLAGIGLFGLSGARESARDGRRKSDLESIRSALEIYKADCGVYPAAPLSSPLIGLETSCSTNTYMEEVPQDPLGGAYPYQPLSSQQRYALCATLESAPSTLPNTADCVCSGCNYIVRNP